jgi:galactose mutarotase-like enzyme
MSPVGPFDGLGGQHGFARWVDYAEIKHRQPGSHDYLTEVPEDHPLIARSFDLFDHSAYITTTLDNCTETPRETSLGEHLYFALTDENANGLRIGTSEATMAEPVKLAEIMRGESQFWPDYQGFALVDFPDGKRVQIKSSVFIDAEAGDTVLKEIEPSAVNIGMLLWHRLGTESICLEPTIGYSDDGRGMVRSDLLKVAAGHAVQLETELTLLAPSMTTVHLPE